MSYQNAINQGDFNLNLVSLRKPLEFPDGSIQEVAYQGAGNVPTLAEVLDAGNDGDAFTIQNISALNINSALGASSLAVLEVLDTTTNKALIVNPVSNNDFLNPMVNAGEITIGGSGANVNLTINSATNVGFKMDANRAIMQAGGTTDTPNVYVQADGTNTRNNIKGDINLLNTYRMKINNDVERVVPTAPALTTAVVPSFEFKAVRVTGNASSASGTITLSSNISNSTDYFVFPSIYYGYSGSAGTYNATNTSQNVGNVIITNIAANQFQWTIGKNTGDNVQIDICFLIVYNMVGQDSAKSW